MFTLRVKECVIDQEVIPENEVAVLKSYEDIQRCRTVCISSKRLALAIQY